MRTTQALTFHALGTLAILAACQVERKFPDPKDSDGGGASSEGGGADGGPSLGGKDSGGGNSTGGLGGEPLGGGSGTGGDSSASIPTVTSVSPEDGEKGVLANSSIKITFSEPMDVVSVEAALDLYIGAAKTENYEVDWNAEKTELTLDPTADFVYSEVTSPTADIPSIKLTVGVGAEDAEGDSLAAKFESSFSVLKRVTHTINRTSSMSGTIRRNDCSSGAAAAYADYSVVGTTVNTGRRGGCAAEDLSGAGPQRGFAHFELNVLPEEVSLESAVAEVTIAGATADDWTVVGTATLQRVSYKSYVTSLQAGIAGAVALGNVFGAPTLATLSPAFTSNGSQNYDIKTHVESLLPAIESNGVDTQLGYRLTGTNTTGTGQVNANTLRLKLVYLTP